MPLDEMSSDLDNLLTEACTSGQLERVKDIIEQWNSHQDSRGPKRLPHRALHAAIENHRPSIVSVLCDQGLRPDYHSFKAALDLKSIEILQIFLNHKWNINRHLFHSMIPPLSYEQSAPPFRLPA